MEHKTFLFVDKLNFKLWYYYKMFNNLRTVIGRGGSTLYKKQERNATQQKETYLFMHVILLCLIKLQQPYHCTLFSTATNLISDKPKCLNETNVICDKPKCLTCHYATNIITMQHNVINVIKRHNFLYSLSLMTFVAYDVCSLMTFVAYRVCRSIV